MKKILVTSALAALALMPASAQKVNKSSGGYPITPVPFTSVKVWNNTFWGQRIETSRKVTIPLAFSKCESEGRYKNFERAAHPSDTYDVGKLMPYSFDDTDPYKTIEGASYVLQTYPDKKLKAYIDSVLDIIAPAQEADGYLYTARTQNPKHPHFWAGDKRWSKEEDLSHELYNLGHMVEGAVAHWSAFHPHCISHRKPLQCKRSPGQTGLSGIHLWYRLKRPEYAPDPNRYPRSSALRGSDDRHDASHTA